MRAMLVASFSTQECQGNVGTIHPRRPTHGHRTFVVFILIWITGNVFKGVFLISMATGYRTSSVPIAWYILAAQYAPSQYPGSTLKYHILFPARESESECRKCPHCIFLNI